MSQYERISDVSRDQRTTELAMIALQEVVRRYPDSDYARDASLKIDLTLDNLAGKEMNVGRFYLERREYARLPVVFVMSSKDMAAPAMRRKRCIGSPKSICLWG